MNEKAEDRQSFIFRFCTTMTAYSAFRADEEADTVAKTGSTVGAGAGYVECVYYIDNLYFSFVEGKSALCIVNSPQNEYALLAGGESEDSSSYRYYGYKDKAYTKIDDIFCYLDSGNYYVNNHESDYEEYMGIVNHWTIQEPVIYIQSNNDDLDTRMANSLIDDTLKDINRVSEKAATGGKGAFGSGAGGGSR